MESEDHPIPMASSERGHPKGIGFYITRGMLPAYPFLHDDAYDHYILGFWYIPSGMHTKDGEQFRTASDSLHKRAMPLFSLLERIEKNHEEVDPYWRPFDEETKEGSIGLIDAWYLTSLFDVVEFIDIFDLSIIAFAEKEEGAEPRGSYVPLKGQEITIPYTEKGCDFARKLFAGIKSAVIHNEIKIPHGRRHLLNAAADEPGRYEETLVDVKDYIRFLVEKADIPREDLPGAMIEVYENNFGTVPKNKYSVSIVKKKFAIPSEDDAITVPIQIMPFVGTTRQGQIQSQNFRMKMLEYTEDRNISQMDDSPSPFVFDQRITVNELAAESRQLCGHTISKNTIRAILRIANVAWERRTSNPNEPYRFPRDVARDALIEYGKTLTDK